MDKEELSVELKECYKNIFNLKNMLNFTQCPIKRMQIEDEILFEINKTLYMLEDYTKYRQREFTIEELSKYDGSLGNPAYIAVYGIVYDVSNSPVWGGGTHFGATAGGDLTSQFEKCHKRDLSKLKNLPIVGTLKV
ncbi:Predicted heme/steroid binding protein [Caloramator quimbayensis]|uniref:Predicted heme/steroid binding protein n=1 Tax=Caloramator quimbayensis TaxID=1147123 RepID=A0A1T4WU65_9CLOT|nr:cytochrome b5 domain-containing protein [Caloramator quimbayensis]SKA80171.1 Predicted heme/steroid binding protein [Caloramator quimbayensis]